MTGKVHYYFYNGHGDVTALADGTGKISTVYDYNAYGEVNIRGESIENPFRYFGQYYDEETGSYYLRARYYEPSLMRSTNEDTYQGKGEDPLSLNKYLYCIGNPVGYVDESGNKGTSITDFYFSVVVPYVALNQLELQLDSMQLMQDISNGNKGAVIVDILYMVVPDKMLGLPLKNLSEGLQKIVKELVKFSDESYEDLTKAALKKLDAVSNNVEWTSHGFKHFPQKNMSWNDIVNSTKFGDARYAKDINIEGLERMAWKNGTSVTSGKTWKVMEFDHVIGACSGKETKYMRVEFSSGTIHGHPITAEEYKKLLK